MYIPLSQHKIYITKPANDLTDKMLLYLMMLVKKNTSHTFKKIEW
jgi:hypothetical protein